MKFKIVMLIAVLLVVSLNLAYAGNDRRIGTAGAQELRIPVGARSVAMGGAVVADVTGVEAVYWNPAGLARMSGTEAMFSYQPYMADIDVNFVGVATRIEDFGTVAVAAKIVSIGDILETTEAAPAGTGRVFSPTLSVLSLSYSRILTANVSFGITGQFIHEKIFEVSATGMAFDIGISYDPQWHGLSMGFVIKNYGPEMEFTGRGFDRSLDGDRAARPIAAPFDLPSSLNMGIAYRFLDQDKNLASLNGNFRSNNYSQDLYQGGFEYVYDDMFSLRGGYAYSDQEEYLYGFSFGGGLKYAINDNTMLSFEYTWSDQDTFDANQFFTVKVQF